MSLLEVVEMTSSNSRYSAHLHSRAVARSGRFRDIAPRSETVLSGAHCEISLEKLSIRLLLASSTNFLRITITRAGA